jgi:hypothetical protein
MNPITSQQFESYLPVFDSVPAKWEDARDILVEQLKLISNMINAREIGYYLDEELLTGKQFIPSAVNTTGEADTFRSVLRMVVNCSPLINGANTFAHNITINSSFTLIDLWVAATNTATLTSQVITGNSVTLNSMNILITSPGAFQVAFCVIEYLQEV